MNAQPGEDASESETTPDADRQIKRKVLKILQDRGGQWTEEEVDHIDSGEIDLAPYLDELVRDGFLYHDRSQRLYVLTDAGGRHLSALGEPDPSPK